MYLAITFKNLESYKKSHKSKLFMLFKKNQRTKKIHTCLNTRNKYTDKQKTFSYHLKLCLNMFDSLLHSGGLSELPLKPLPVMKWTFAPQSQKKQTNHCETPFKLFDHGRWWGLALLKPGFSRMINIVSCTNATQFTRDDFKTEIHEYWWNQMSISYISVFYA